MEPILNSQLPEFSVQAFHNGSFKTVTNNDVKGKWAIFFFYPADFTFVCPTELVDMAEKYDQFKAMGVEVYSVSTDSHFVHKAWHFHFAHRGRITANRCFLFNDMGRCAQSAIPPGSGTTLDYGITLQYKVYTCKERRVHPIAALTPGRSIPPLHRVG